MTDYTVTTKHVAAVDVAYARDKAPTMDQLPATLGKLFGAAYNLASAHDAIDGLSIAMYHDTDWTGKDIDVSAAFILTKPIPAPEEDSLAGVCTFPAATMAFAMHEGAYATMSQAYDAVLKWTVANGYKVVGPGREVYVHCGADGNDPANRTEIQFPVEKI